MTRRYTVPATVLTRQSLPEKPSLWCGKPDLIEANESVTAGWDDAERPGRRVEPFSWPMPLPGPPARSGSGSAAAKAARRRKPEPPGDGERTQVA